MLMRHINIQFFVLFVVLLGLESSAFSDVKYYESGLLRDLEYLDPPSGQSIRPIESEMITEFFKQHFGNSRSEEGQWREWKKVGSSTHNHHHYHYFYKNRRVDGVGLSLHYNRNGWVQYASSDLEKKITQEFEPDSPEVRQRISKSVSGVIAEKSGRRFKELKWEPILWRGPSHPEFIAAYQVKAQFEKPYQTKFFIVEQNSGEILSAFEKVRFEGGSRPRVSVKVYENSAVSVYPAAPSTDFSFTNKTPNQLDSDQFHIYRDQDNGATISTEEIVPANYAVSLSFKPLPVDYDASCSSVIIDGTSCPNQSFDGVNVFYHLSQYRTNVIGPSFTVIGQSPSFSEPLSVIVNGQSVRPDLFGGSNNAFYYPEDCSATIDRCLVFLPPAILQQADYPGCSGGELQPNNLAREGFVIAHEYQHFITDQISGIEESSSGISVGDALHEGFSDYAGATHLSSNNNLTDATVTTGLVSFDDCTGERRDVGTLKVFEKDGGGNAKYNSGLSWASGLWKLRTEYQKTVVDPLVLKSLYFLGSNPGFVTATEALVKADRALWGGAHVNRIRQVMYSEIKFLGESESPFKDPSTGEAYVGFKGCGGVGFEKNHGIGSGIVFLVWGIVTLFLGRVLARKPQS